MERGLGGQKPRWMLVRYRPMYSDVCPACASQFEAAPTLARPYVIRPVWRNGKRGLKAEGPADAGKSSLYQFAV
ncbi:hypothetical protein BaRGS_00003872, partial [Batillaria attramentaria]